MQFNSPHVAPADAGTHTLRPVLKLPRQTPSATIAASGGAGVRGDDGMPLASRAQPAYITPAKLCRASGAIYPRGLIDPSGNCPWPGPWTWLHGAHLLS